MPPETHTVIVAPQEGPGADGERLDRHLAVATGISRSRLKALIEAGAVTESGATIEDPSHRVKPGERYVIAMPEAVAAEPLGQAIPLSIAYEDEHLVIVDKPAGMVVHPAAGNPDGTLVNALLAHCGASLSGIGGVKRPGIVHRIDKDTSGLLVAAKHDRAHEGLSKLFAAHDIERAYAAICWGVPSPAQGTIEGNIGRDSSNRKRMAVLRGGGKPAITHYKVAQAFGTAAALINLELETGRTHQIRVHLNHLGHPILGDPVYGRASRARRDRLPERARAAAEGFGRQALHARILGFVHPVTGESIRCESPLPPDMTALLAALNSP